MTETSRARLLTTRATVHNVVMCKRIVDAVVNAKKTEEGEKVGKDGTGEAGKEIGDPMTQERKLKKAKSGTEKEKKKEKDVPSWAHGKAPYADENDKDFAKSLCDEYYGEGNYEPRKNKNYSKIKKWGGGQRFE